MGKTCPDGLYRDAHGTTAFCGRSPLWSAATRRRFPSPQLDAAPRCFVARASCPDPSGILPVTRHGQDAHGTSRRGTPCGRPEVGHADGGGQARPVARRLCAAGRGLPQRGSLLAALPLCATWSAAAKTAALRREVHAAHQVLKAWVGAQAVEFGVYFEVGN